MLVLDTERANSFLSSLWMDSPFHWLPWNINPVLTVWELKVRSGKTGNRFSVHLFTKLKNTLKIHTFNVRKITYLIIGGEMASELQQKSFSALFPSSTAWLFVIIYWNKYLNRLNGSFCLSPQLMQYRNKPVCTHKGWKQVCSVFHCDHMAPFQSSVHVLVFCCNMRDIHHYTCWSVLNVLNTKGWGLHIVIYTAQLYA